MDHESNIEYELVESTQDLSVFRDRTSNATLNEAMTVAISNAAVVILPTQFRDRGLLFPDGTTRLVRYLKTNLPQDVKLEIAITPDDYREVSLHDDLLILASLLIQAPVTQIVLGLITNYISDFMKRPSDRIELNISIKENPQTGTSVKTFRYKGKASHIGQATQAIHDLWNQLPESRNSDQ